MKLILEQRYLFDGSIGAVGHHAAHIDSHDALHPDAHAPAVAPTDVPGASARPVPQDHAAAPASNVTTLLIVDPRVTNWQNLVGGTKLGVEVVVLDPNQDGVTQVTHALQGLTGVKNLEFLTDGTSGAITLGGGTLDLGALTARASEITGWSASLSTSADIVFWGCDVAQGNAGAAFVADMHTLTGATIGASSDATGASSLGGNWKLEVATGDLHRDVLPFSAAAVTDYAGLLDTPIPTVTLTSTGTLPHTAAGTALLGDTINVAMSFTNAAANNTGYGPFIELFAPAALTLSGSPTAGGASLVTQTVAVDGAGHFTNPLTHLVETAPGGIVSGSAYIVQLPYGSFTPNEPAVAVAASFTMANTAALVGTTLPVEARAGFQFGALATGGTPIIGAAATSNETVALTESWLTFTTVPGEGETATGPDFPVQYTVHVESAPAVAATATPITNLSFAILLPNAIIETGAATATGGGTASITTASAGGGTEQTLHVAYGSLSDTQTATFAAYVPQFYQYTDGSHTSGVAILDPTTGAPAAIPINPSYTYAADNWNARAISGTGDVSGGTLTAKALAVQLVADTSSAVPTQSINYTLNYQVSDYFGIHNLALGAILGDGLTFDPTSAPVLSFTGRNGGISSATSTFVITPGGATAAFSDPLPGSPGHIETVQASGGGSFMTYAFNGGSSGTTVTGQTTLKFDVGGLLPGQVGAGSTGNVTFRATVLDRYPTGTDNAGAGGFLREGDSVSASSTTTLDHATLDPFALGSYTVTSVPVSDFTATPVDTLPLGDYALVVRYVNGAAYAGLAIKPGDIVVYEMTYRLAAPGIFANLGLTAYVPEPVFSVINPATPDSTTPAAFAGAGTATFTSIAYVDTTTAPNLAGGQYTYAVSSGLAGVTVGGGIGSEPTNSVAFTVSAPGPIAYDTHGGSSTPETVTIDFAVVASSLPMADGLKLTAQGDSTFTPAVAPVLAIQRTQILTIAEPILVTQEGVVSVVNDNGINISGAAGIAWTLAGATAAAPTVFAPAGSGTVFTGAIPNALTPAQDNLDVSGAQAGDVVRIVDVVQNTGHQGAFDVIVKAALSQALASATITHLTFTRGDGAVMETIDPTTGALVTGSAALSAYFSSTGLMLVDPVTHNSTVAALGSAGTATGIVYATYDVALPSSTPTAATLTGKDIVVAYTNQDLYVHSAGTAYTLNLPASGTDGNFANSPAIGAILTDTATIVTLAPSVTDTITGAVDLSDLGATVPANTFNTHTATLVPGETVNLSATITLPQGVTTNLSLTDILPAGLTMTTTSGNATYTDSAGSHTVAFTVSGNILTLAGANYTVPLAAGGDAPATITFAYNALVPQTQASPIDTTSWVADAASGNLTRTDTFAATSEGIAYLATTATDLATVTAAASASGLANTVTVTNPLVTVGITENITGAVHSGEAITYTLTLTNLSSSATAYDLGSLLTLPTGLTYGGDLAQTSGTAAQLVSNANVGTGGAATGSNAVDGITLAPGATATFTFSATVNNNLPAGTTLLVSAKPAWESLPHSAAFDGGGNVNPQAQAYSGAQATLTNNVAVITPTLTIIGESNNTGTGATAFNPLATTLATQGEIVRMRAVLQIPEGQNANTALVVTLPTGVTFTNGGTNTLVDGSTTVALISPGGVLSSDTLTNPLVQQPSGAVALNRLSLAATGTTDPVTFALPTGAITGITGQAATFNVGTLTDNQSSANPDYVVVEFNVLVGANTPATSGTPLATAMFGQTFTNPTTTTTAPVIDGLTVLAPNVTLAKVIENVVYGAGGAVTITYQDTMTNSGNSVAYTVALDDPGAGATGAVNYIGTTGPNTVVGTTGVAGHFDATLNAVAAGTSQTLTYTVTLTAGQIAAAVAASDTPAGVTSYALNPLLETSASQAQSSEALVSTLAAPTQYTANASAGFDLVSGRVNQDVSPSGNDFTLVALAGQTVAVTLPGGTETVATDSSGNYAVLVPDQIGPVAIVVTTTAPNAPANGPLPTPLEALNNAAALIAGLPSASATSTDPATLTFTPAAHASYVGQAFDFYRGLDTAPVLTGATVAVIPAVAGSAITPFAAATVADAQLDGTFSHDFSGTTLTMQRYVGATATPDATDVFGSAGTSTAGLFLSAGSLGSGNVLLSGATVGTYTEAGGVLTIHFAATGVANTTVNSVLNAIKYTSTAGGSAIVIGAQIDDANNDPIALNGAALDLAGPHDQGPGGDMLSNVLTATVNVSPIAPGLSIIGESNVTTGSTASFDPTGQTTGTAVTTTEGGIVRMRAVVQLPEGTNTASDIVVTLPGGLTYQNDGSANVLLASPGGNVGTTLTGAGLQLAEGATPIDKTLRSLGSGAADPVTATLGGGAISVAGQMVTFNLGTLTNPNAAPGPNYVVVEFNAVVGANAPATSSPLPSAMHGDANAAATATVNDYVSIIAPNVTLAKVIKNIAYNGDGTITVTYLDTETNTGNAPAYNVRLTDHGAGTGTVAYVSTSGSNSVAAAGPTGSDFNSVVASLPGGGGAQSFTFTATFPASALPSGVSDLVSQAVVTSNALNPANETLGQETLAGTSLTPTVYSVTATAGLDLVSGTVNQDVSPTVGTDNPLVPLGGQTVSVSFAGQIGAETTVTDGSGHYSVLVPDTGVPTTLTVTTTFPNAPAPDALDNGSALAASAPSGSESGANPAALTFTPAANTNYAPVAFDLWRPLDTSPSLAGSPPAPLPEVVGSPVIPFAAATVSDTQLDGPFGHDFSATTLTLQRYIGSMAAPDVSDVFTGSGSPTAGVSLSAGSSGSGSVLLAGVSVGTYTEAGGVLSVKFAATGVANTTVNAVLQGIAYTSTLVGNPLIPGVVIGAQIDDANNDPIALNGNTLDPTGPHDQGPGGDMLSNVLTATIDVAAANGTGGGAVASTFTEPNDFNPATVAVAVNPTADLTNLGHTSGVPSRVTLAIAGTHVEDVLVFANTADITGSYSSGTMTLTGVAGHTPTLAAWQAAIRAVQYYDSSDVPNVTTRNITVTVTASGNTATELATMAIVPVNDSPILDSSVVVALNDSTEYQGTATPTPSGAVGTLVSQLAGLHANVTDPDGAGLVNGAAPTAPGIAITGFSTTDAGGRSVGSWYFSIDGGATWTAFPATISIAQPLDLASTARVAFQPVATNFNGQIPNAITFRAWDRFDGAANGTQANLAGVTAFGQSAANNAAATAYSIATDTLPLTIDNVNNAPDASGTASVPPVSTSEQHPPGQTVSQLFNGGFSDPRDNQVIAIDNPHGSTLNPFAGVAITGNAATHNQGVWEYSVDGGATWTAIPTTVSQANAVILPANARIAFQPTDGFSGNPGLLSFNVIDSSTTTVAPGLTGAQLAAEGSGGVPLAAVTNVNIPAVGGSSAFSATTITLSTLVNPLPPARPDIVVDPTPALLSGFPDDQKQEPTGVNFWTTDDYLSRPLIPDLSLVGSVANRFIIESQHAVISVPSNIFQDSLPQAQLSYEAKLPDGSSLPSWLTFNANDLTFTGTPPAGSYGRISILIRARDIAGNTADATFNILIGRDQRDLVSLLKPGHHSRLFLPRQASNVAHGLQQATAAMQAAELKLAEHPAHATDHVAVRAAWLADLPPPGPQAGGFSSALHAAGPMSALGRARAWLDTLNDMDRRRPAA